ncbi:uncharacterized protein METZ01_LOCUS105896 [marine metagenome]|uniref:Uncharacterized protein n=1 Tax=marine metagenome TaxID=408172 RepID=A0A381WKS2_9ZZZZ
MTKTRSNEGAFLVSETPPSRSHRGGVLVAVVVWLAGPMTNPTHGPSASSLGTWNLVWNFGRSFTGFPASMTSSA